MSLAHDVETILARFGSTGVRRALEGNAPAALSLSWPGLNDVLPDGGLPRGVVELAAPHALGGSTSLALAAVRAGQARTRTAWCAWVDPEGTLHAPGVVASGVDLARMLVVRPPLIELVRVAVKVALAGAFQVTVVAFDSVPGAVTRFGQGEGALRKRAWAPELLV